MEVCLRKRLSIPNIDYRTFQKHVWEARETKHRIRIELIILFSSIGAGSKRVKTLLLLTVDEKAQWPLYRSYQESGKATNRDEG